MCVGLYHEQEVLKEEVIRRKREIEKLSQQVWCLYCHWDFGPPWIMVLKTIIPKVMSR